MAENIQKVYKNKCKTSLGWRSKKPRGIGDKEVFEPLQSMNKCKNNYILILKKFYRKIFSTSKVIDLIKSVQLLSGHPLCYSMHGINKILYSISRRIEIFSLNLF
jgi:hypothetical protein